MLEDLIYLCVPNKKGYLHRLNLPFYKFSEDNFISVNNRESVLEALKFRSHLGYLGKQYRNVYTVCTPAADIQLVMKPQILTGYIKTCLKSDIECYFSGHRSAIMMDKGKAIRLKGCGNDLVGFEFVEGKGLRGSHFYHTSKRELFMTNHINKVLATKKFQGANTPIGFYEFQRGFTSQLPTDSQIKDELPLLPKYCCIFQTKGQRRAGTHLISSLQVLMANFVDVNWQALHSDFKAINRIEDDSVSDTPTEWIFQQVHQDQLFLSLYDKKHKQQQQVLSHFKYFSSNLFNKECVVKDWEQKMSEIEKTYKIGIQYTELLRTKLTKLAKQTKLLDLIMLIAARIGWEVGVVKRLFCQHGINWGFFTDHGVTHCNAHLNNFAVMKPENKMNLLAPLDFDLSFTKEQYIDIDMESKSYGQRNNTQFERSLQGQFTALQLSLSGMEIMNFQYGILQGEQAKRFQMLKNVFRDTLVNHYIQGMLDKPFEFEQLWQQRIHELNDLVTTCLIVSMDFET